MTKYPAEVYAEQVRDGRILVCEYVRLAVRRYYADLDRALERGGTSTAGRRCEPSVSSSG